MPLGLLRGDPFAPLHAGPPLKAIRLAHATESSSPSAEGAEVVTGEAHSQCGGREANSSMTILLDTEVLRDATVAIPDRIEHCDPG